MQQKTDLRSNCVSSLFTARPQSEVRKWCSGLHILHVKSCMLVFIPPFDTKGRHPLKKVANFRALPESGGGGEGLPMPKFVGPFFAK